MFTGGKVLGMSSTVVTPPTTAAADPVEKIFLYRQARIAKVDVGIDGARQHPKPAHVDHLSGGLFAGPRPTPLARSARGTNASIRPAASITTSTSAAPVSSQTVPPRRIFRIPTVSPRLFDDSLKEEPLSYAMLGSSLCSGTNAD